MESASYEAPSKKMNPLALKLKTQIAKSGPMLFSDYMALCLFDPEHGYYSNLQAIGSKGDFVTAPELGPYFAQALGRFLAPELAAYQQPVILELGGGSGQLAYDLLQTLHEAGRVPARYLILEKSPSLRRVQQHKLAPLSFAKVEWVEELHESHLEGVILANEFFDALPIERFIKTTQGLEKTYVDWQAGQFIETGSGERLEKCLILPEVLTPILTAFQKGLALIVDYGAETINRSTLTAYFQHQIVSPFLRPGECDITAHVDFTFLAEAILNLGWDIAFLKPQNQFLLEQGILPDVGIEVEDYAMKRLLDPRLMGERFKVLMATFNQTFT